MSRHKCSQLCEVCSCHVQVDVVTGEVQQCGLDLGDMADLDLGYMSDCPFDVADDEIEDE